MLSDAFNRIATLCNARALFILKSQSTDCKIFPLARSYRSVVKARLASLNSTGNYANVGDFRRCAKYPWDLPLIFVLIYLN